MRSAFVTCVQLGLACMEEIYHAGGALDLVVTLPDEKARAKSGRIYPDAFCAGHGVELLKFANVNDPACVAAITERDIDWLFIIGWSQIARPEVLAAPRRGALGMHPTLLPVGRGRAAIPWAILKGLPETGVTLFQLDTGVDTGPILAQELIPIAADEDAGTLYAKVAAAHRLLMRHAWPALAAGTLRAVPQDESRATVWPGRNPADGRLDPGAGVVAVDRLVRATTRPYPGAFLEVPEGTLRIWHGRIAAVGTPPRNARRIACADGAYDATEWDLEPATASAL